MATGRRVWSCPICCEPPGDIAHALPCHHQFCLGCILRWLRGKSTCPLCRRVISTISFSEQADQFLHILIRAPNRPTSCSNASSTQGPVASPVPASQGTASPCDQGAAEPETMGGILPELWAELFRRRQHLLNPVRCWLRQRLQKIYQERWWQVKTAESSILLALCIFGPDREVLVKRLQPRLRHYTPLLVRGMLGIIETQCSREVRRLRRCHAAQEEEESPEGSSGLLASSGPSSSPQDAAASAGPLGSNTDEAAQGSPSPLAPVTAEPEQP